LTRPSSRWWPDYVSIDARSATDVYYTDQADNPFGCAGVLWHFNGTSSRAIGPSGTCKPTAVVIGTDNRIYFQDARRDAFVNVGDPIYYRSTDPQGSDWIQITRSQWREQWLTQHEEDSVTVFAKGGSIVYTYEGNTIYRERTTPRPAAPSAVDVEVSGTSATISWEAVDEAESYRAEVVGAGEECATDQTTCTIAGLVLGETYEVVVYAVGPDEVESNPSDPVAFTVPLIAAPSEVTALPSGTIAVVSWTSSAGATSYRVTASPGGATCETSLRSCTVSGLVRGTRYAVRVQAISGDTESDPSSPESFVAGDRPGMVGPVTVESGAGVAVVSWGPPESNGDSPLEGFTVTSNPGDRACYAAPDEVSCDIAGLTPGVPYLFSVAAVNGGGAGTARLSDEARSFSWPGTPENVRVGITTSSSAEVRWNASSPNGSAISGYVVEVSRDGGGSWSSTEVTGTTLKTFLSELAGPARAGWVRVSAMNANGRSAWSEPVLITSKGARPMRVEVVDSDGVPVIGGAITWAMRDVPVQSSKVYGLTADGVIDFPSAPAGWVEVEVTGALTASGARVTGTFTEVLGFQENILSLPSAPTPSRTVRVVIPGATGALPVPGARVTVDPDARQYTDADCLEWAYGTLASDDWCLDYAEPSVRGGVDYSVSIDGFVFSVDPASGSNATGPDGTIVIPGFMEGHPVARVSYDDGVIDQGKDVVLRTANTDVELDYMPWLEVANDDLTAASGALVPIEVSIETASGESSTAATTLASWGRVSRSAGVRVTVIPPAGAARGTCKPKLTAVTNSSGSAQLRVCATKSGEYRFKTTGAAAVGSVQLRVRGAAPLPPTAVTVRSPEVGQARITWNPPSYSGGLPVTGYTITASARGKRTVTRNVSGSVRTLTLSGLANATSYTVSITARTARGASDPVRTSVPVA
jgi:hypothetical protein